MDILTQKYYEPSDPGSFGGVNRLYRSLKEEGRPQTKAQIEEFLSNQNTYTLHKEKRHKFPRNRIITLYVDQQWAADLADMSAYARSNSGNRFILTVIDVFSKYLWLRVLKNKKPESVTTAFESILKEGRVPTRLRTDRGTEFLNRKFAELLKTYNITHLTSTNKTYKAATVERVQRTLKGRMFRFFTRIGSHRYIDRVNDFVSGYNNSYHRTIKMTPIQALTADRQQVFRNTYGVEGLTDLFDNNKPSRIKTGDTVRIAYDRGVFDKGYWRTYSDKTAEVKDVLDRPRPMYILKDHSGEITRRYYPEEIQKIPEPSYRVEKVIKTRVVDGKRQYLVKFVGYPSSENSWVDNLEPV